MITRSPKNVRYGWLGLALLGLFSLLLGGGKAHAASDVVVMIHGAGGGGWEYDRWRPIFAHNGWKVIALDLVPVSGGLEATHFDDYVKQVLEWIPVRRKKLVIVGASMGGVLALKVAEKVPVDALILVNSAPPLGVGPARISKTYPPVIRWANGPIEDTRASLPDGDEATVRWAHPKWRDEAGSVLNALRQGVPIQSTRVPTLAVLGGKDTDVPLETGLALAIWAHADIHLYAEASHIGPLYGLRAKEIASASMLWLRAVLKQSK